jgi:alpha-amylase
MNMLYKCVIAAVLIIVLSAISGCAPEETEEHPTGVFYEIFVRSFYDSNGDGIGDINGVIEKLDYLNDGDPNTDTDLGVEGIWLMPINPSPSYHGYDVTDYYDIHPDYGTLEDFRRFMDEAEQREIKVIMDLVVNHSSSQHPWFEASAKGGENEYRDWYIWADAEQSLNEISAVGGKAWHAKNGGHYLGIFWDGMPDLNLDHHDVRQEMIRIGQFWLEQGVDGFRLDAAKHIFEDLQSTKGEPGIIDKNIVWWNEFREGMNEINPEAYIIGEVWENSPVLVAPYLEPFDSGFNFGAAAELINNAKTETASEIAFKLRRIYGLYDKASQGKFIDAPFLANHDQNRVMSELHGNVDHAKMAAAQLLTLPGRPYIYYGEEIGMQGMKPDEYIREPMLWYADGAKEIGQTSWITTRFNRENPPSVEAQLEDPDSLLNHYKRLIRWRGQEPVLINGAIREYDIDNTSILAYLRTLETENVLVVHNLSGENQMVNLVEGIEGSENSALQVVLSSKEEYTWSNPELNLPPYSTVVLK